MSLIVAKFLTEVFFPEPECDVYESDQNWYFDEWTDHGSKRRL